jgi:hypothetical protein
MAFLAKYVVTTLRSLLLAVAFLPAAMAQSQGTMATPASPESPNPADQGWHVDIAPYLWIAGITGTVGAAGHQTSVHVTASDIFSDLNFGLMGAAEIRYNRFLIPIDCMWVKLSDDKGLPFDPGVLSVKVRINEVIFTPKVGYRILSKDKFKLDYTIGIRYWHIGNTLTLQPTPIGNGFYATANWVDGVQGARFIVMLTPKAELTIAGDAGAGGARLDYQVVGLLGYKLKKMTLQGGWRYLAIHKSPVGQAFVDLAMSGVVAGVVIPLK